METNKDILDQPTTYSGTTFSMSITKGEYNNEWNNIQDTEELLLVSGTISRPWGLSNNEQ